MEALSDKKKQKNIVIHFKQNGEEWIIVAKTVEEYDIQYMNGSCSLFLLVLFPCGWVGKCAMKNKFCLDF
jgi:hypothetical protein